jgi:hypothetical protein
LFTSTPIEHLIWKRLTALDKRYAFSILVIWVALSP